MELHQTDWTHLIVKLQASLGASASAEAIHGQRETIVGLLHSELAQYDRKTIRHALDVAAAKAGSGLGWSPFLCRALSALPGTWSKLSSQVGFDASTMLLLTDGSVMVQEQGGLRWKKLTPNLQGSYVDGSWSDLAPMHHTRRYYASAVLRDGRVFVCGGEYSDAGDETTATEIYDPTLDSWTELTPPSGWVQVGDAACAVLPDGRVLLGSIETNQTALFDPETDTFSTGPLKGSSSSEESWVLLPDGTIVTVRCDGSKVADKYVSASNSWVSGGSLPTSIVETSSSEIGAGILLESGKALFIGANGHNALYTPPASAADPGSWTMAPDFPNDTAGQTVGCKDSPACLMTNGKVLIAAGPVDGQRGDFLPPTYFFEYDGAALRRVPDPANAGGMPYIGRMLLLPSGQILFAAQTNEIYVYNYFACPSAAARPHITSAPSIVRPLRTYTLEGRLFNGLSQAVGYGDDASAATNYPIVRIRHLASGSVRYCRTFDHSTMAVATGASLVTTNFALPLDAPLGAAELVVVANGIASPPVLVEVARFHFPWPVFEEAVFTRLIGSLADGPLWAWGPHGPVPVDPQGPWADAARVVHTQLVSDLRELRRIGGEVFGSRHEIASAAPLAPDDDDDEEQTLFTKKAKREDLAADATAEE